MLVLKKILSGRPLVWASLFMASVSVFPLSASAETLQEAFVSAYQSHPVLLAERERLKEIDETYVQAKAAGRMSSSLNASQSYTTLRFHNAANAGTYLSEETEPGALQLSVIQPLYQGGRVKALKSQAMAGIFAAREGLRAQEQGIFLSVANAYISVYRDEEAARIRRENVRVLTRQRAAAQERFDVGVGTRTDIAQAETRLAAAEIGLAQADAQLQISRAGFERLVGHPPLLLEPVPSLVLPTTLEAAVGLGRENNPRISAAVYNEQAADAAINVARANGRPVVSLNGGLGGARHTLSGPSHSQTATIGANVTVPIFSGGLNKSRVRVAKHARSRAGFETRDIERGVDEAVKQAWAQLEGAKLSLRASQVQVESAKVAFEGVSLEQDVGTRSALDVLNAEQELRNAQLNQLNAESTLRQSEFQLLAAIGALDVKGLDLPVEAYNPAGNFESIQEDKYDRIIDKIVPDQLEEAIETLRPKKN